MRINKYLSQIGICSRREADKLVDSRRVKVNNEIAILGTKIIVITVDRTHFIKDIKISEKPFTKHSNTQ